MINLQSQKEINIFYRTTEMQITDSFGQLYKYADDLVLMKVGPTVSQSTYFIYIAEFTGWCNDSCLYINASNTMDLVIESHQRIEDLPPATVNDQQVEAVSSLNTYLIKLK